MAEATVVCPHCGSTGTYHHSLATGSGSFRPQCRACHKSFKVEIRSGRIDRVTK